MSEKCDCHLIFDSSENLEEKVKMHLKKVKDAKQTWNVLHCCRVCGQYWEVSYPAAGDVCCVEPQILKLTEKEAREIYGI